MMDVAKRRITTVIVVGAGLALSAAAALTRAQEAD
jgi:hypothetical protein